MNQRAQAEKFRYIPYIPSSATTVTPEEYSMLYRKTKRKWRFKPKSSAPLIAWAVVLFILGKIVLFPLGEGIYNYILKTHELNALQKEYKNLDQQMATMTKNRDYMLTPAYILERAHQIGMVKANETQMVVVDGASDDEISKLTAQRGKKVEIGD